MRVLFKRVYNSISPPPLLPIRSSDLPPIFFFFVIGRLAQNDSWTDESIQDRQMTSRVLKLTSKAGDDLQYAILGRDSGRIHCELQTHYRFATESVRDPHTRAFVRFAGSL